MHKSTMGFVLLLMFCDLCCIDPEGSIDPPSLFSILPWPLWVLQIDPLVSFTENSTLGLEAGLQDPINCCGNSVVRSDVKTEAMGAKMPDLGMHMGMQWELLQYWRNWGIKADTNSLFLFSDQRWLEMPLSHSPLDVLVSCFHVPKTLTVVTDQVRGQNAFCSGRGSTQGLFFHVSVKFLWSRKGNLMSRVPNCVLWATCGSLTFPSVALRNILAELLFASHYITFR